MIVTTLLLLADRFKQLLILDCDRVGAQLHTFAHAIHAAGAPLDNCWGFIDGTARPICRPRRDQRLFYSGHKRVHCLKFQAVTTPDGIIAHLHGPVEGRRHDLFLVLDSNIKETMEKAPFAEYVLYGDPGYNPTNWMVAPYKGAQVTPAQAAFNAAMSSVRVTVEWSFGRVTSLWRLLDFAPALRVLSSPIGSYYQVAVLLTNCRTALDGRNEVSDQFQVKPPSLGEYVANAGRCGRTGYTSSRV